SSPRLGGNHAKTGNLIRVKSHLISQPLGVQSPSFTKRCHIRIPSVRRKFLHFTCHRKLKVVSGNALVKSECLTLKPQLSCWIRCVHPTNSWAGSVSSRRLIITKR